MAELTRPVGENDHIRGQEKAPVTLVEYGDFECPYCGEAYYIVKKIQEDFPDDLRYVFRNFPLVEIHPHALGAALAAEAAGVQGKFWEMHDMLYENQDNLEDTDLISYAKDLELNIDQFVTDMSSEKLLRKVQDDITSGNESGVTGTPTFFINGKLYGDSYEYEILHAAIEEEIGGR